MLLVQTSWRLVRTPWTTCNIAANHSNLLHCAQQAIVPESIIISSQHMAWFDDKLHRSGSMKGRHGSREGRMRGLFFTFLQGFLLWFINLEDLEVFSCPPRQQLHRGKPRVTVPRCASWQRHYCRLQCSLNFSAWLVYCIRLQLRLI